MYNNIHYSQIVMESVVFIVDLQVFVMVKICGYEWLLWAVFGNGIASDSWDWDRWVPINQNQNWITCEMPQLSKFVGFSLYSVSSSSNLSFDTYSRCDHSFLIKWRQPIKYVSIILQYLLTYVGNIFLYDGLFMSVI